MSEQHQTPEMALALYASTAATLAVKGLQRAGHVTGPEIGALVDNLMACRTIAGQDPRIEEHIELLTDQLLSETGQP